MPYEGTGRIISDKIRKIILNLLHRLRIIKKLNRDQTPAIIIVFEAFGWPASKGYTRPPSTAHKIAAKNTVVLLKPDMVCLNFS